MTYKIVSDSASNRYDFYGVDYANVPLKIISDEKEYVDVPGLDVPGMIRELREVKTKTGTSCPNAHEWEEQFRSADAVFAVTITSGLSGSHASALQARAEVLRENPQAKIYIIDSLSAGPEMPLLMEKLRERIQAGDSFEVICEAIDAYQKHTHLLFSLQSLMNLARNGRVSPAVAKIAGILGIRVVGKASDEGTLEPLHKCRGEKRALETVFREMKNHGYSGGKVRIAHCLNPEGGEGLRRLIHGEFPQADVSLEPCTGLCSYYAEQGGLMIGYEDALGE